MRSSRDINRDARQRQLPLMMLLLMGRPSDSKVLTTRGCLAGPGPGHFSFQGWQLGEASKSFSPVVAAIAELSQKNCIADQQSRAGRRWRCPTLSARRALAGDRDPGCSCWIRLKVSAPFPVPGSARPTPTRGKTDRLKGILPGLMIQEAPSSSTRSHRQCAARHRLLPDLPAWFRKLIVRSAGDRAVWCRPKWTMPPGDPDGRRLCSRCHHCLARVQRKPPPCLTRAGRTGGLLPPPLKV